MANDQEGPSEESLREAREIPKWAQRYAQNRTLTVIVLLAIFYVGFAVFGGLSYLTGWAYHTGRTFLAVSSTLVLVGFAAWWLWFSFIGAARMMRGVSERLYQGEGGVLVGAGAGRVEGKGGQLVAFVFILCVMAGVVLGSRGSIPIRLMQPVSALYVVPFLCYLGIKQRGAGSPFMFLWPALYGIHAVLLVTGVPIGMGPMLDMLVPTAGYGLVAALAGHVYSRYALRRLKHLAASAGSADQGSE
jgi:hypothetical protein